MGFPDLFKLEKLMIEAFSKRSRKANESLGSMEAMFNPTTVNQKYAIKYATAKELKATPQAAHYERTAPETLDLQLLFDGTGVDQIGLLTLFGDNKTVADRIAALLKLCYETNGNIHEPNYLTVTWGEFLKKKPGGGFRGRLASLSIAYQSFNRDGSPLRAQCDVALIADDALDRQAGITAFNSPDLTHSKLVRTGDTLPLLTEEIYGTSRHVAKVARANDLDQFRALEPGRELLFPPIER